MTSGWPHVEEKLPSYQYELSVILNRWLSPQHNLPYNLIDPATFIYHLSYDLHNLNQRSSIDLYIVVVSAKSFSSIAKMASASQTSSVFSFEFEVATLLSTG